MARGACTFRQRDLSAAIKASVAAGLSVQRVEVDRDGRIVIIAGEPNTDRPAANANEWDGAA